MLYTIISEYDIFTREGEIPQANRFRSIASGTNGRCRGMVEYFVCGKNKVVKSLFSTDSEMYLDKRYFPGSRL